uniref:dTDP-4-dehydrorhamnose reductase n=1 Tax=Meloidogyne hapla TaxID=6305 RepID=A0A1I8BLV1_MELHA
MRMCIIGGGGYLGQLLAQALQNEGGHFVVLFDLNFLASFPHIKLNEQLTQRIEGSIECSDQLIEALEGCDACFHLAGYGMSGGPSVVVIFDGHTELYMADEDTPYLQSSQYGNYYAESKSAAEQLILAENCPPKLSTCALRLRGIYGPGE